jgi:hypothetical protein
MANFDFARPCSHFAEALLNNSNLGTVRWVLGILSHNDFQVPRTPDYFLKLLLAKMTSSGVPSACIDALTSAVLGKLSAEQRRADGDHKVALSYWQGLQPLVFRDDKQAELKEAVSSGAIVYTLVGPASFGACLRASECLGPPTLFSTPPPPSLPHTTPPPPLPPPLPLSNFSAPAH